jgi:hypothetical protein
MAETEDEIPDAGLNFATRPRLISWNQKQLRALARQGEERAFIDLTKADLNHAVSQNIPQNWLLEGKCWLRWTFGTEVYHLDPDRYLDLRDWSDPQLERLLQQLRDGEVLVEAVNDKEIAAAKSTEADNPCTAKTPVCTLHLTFSTLHIALCTTYRRHSVDLELTKYLYLTKIITHRNRINSYYIFASN